MNIGLDFDGVISDAGKLKSDGAKKLYNIDIPPEKCKKEMVVGEGWLSLEQYRALQKRIYGTREIGLLMNEVKDAGVYIKRLLKEGHILTVVTSRGVPESIIAKEWMVKRRLNLPIKSVGKDISKKDACRGLHTFIDDDLEKLEPLVGVVPHRFLFNWAYNKDIPVALTVAKRVDSWKHFYEEIQKIEKKRITKV